MAEKMGILGRKLGMTRIFADDGTSIPVTVVDVADNRVTQVKTPENDGYAAIQVAYGERRASRVNKPAAGHFAKAGVQAGSILKEFRLDNINDFKAGDNLKVDAIFSEGQKVDVFKAVLNAITFPRNVPLTVIQYHITPQVLSVKHKIQVAYFRANVWPVTLVLKKSPNKV